MPIKELMIDFEDFRSHESDVKSMYSINDKRDYKYYRSEYNQDTMVIIKHGSSSFEHFLVSENSSILE